MLSPPDLRSLCADEFAFGFFRDFCKQQMIEETVLFVRAVASFRETPNKEQEAAARFIAKMFFDEGSATQVNVDNAVAGPLQARVAAGGSEVSASVFDEAEAVVLTQLQQTYAFYLMSDAHARMEAERSKLHARMFGAEELAAFREAPPVQLLVHHSAARVLETLRNPHWWERADDAATVAVSQVGPGELVQSRSSSSIASISYLRDVTTRVGPLVFRNVLATTQWSEGEAVVMHCRDRGEEAGLSLVARFFCTPVGPDCCVVVEREFLRPNSLAASLAAKLGAKQILKARRGHLHLLASKTAAATIK